MKNTGIRQVLFDAGAVCHFCRSQPPFPEGKLKSPSTQDHHLVVPPHQHHRRQTQLRDTIMARQLSTSRGRQLFYTIVCFALLILIDYFWAFLFDFLLSLIPSFSCLGPRKHKTSVFRVDPSCRLPRNCNSTEACIQNSTPSFLVLGCLAPLPRQNNPLPPPSSTGLPCSISEFLDTVRPSLSQRRSKNNS